MLLIVLCIFVWLHVARPSAHLVFSEPPRKNPSVLPSEYADILPKHGPSLRAAHMHRSSARLVVYLSQCGHWITDDRIHISFPPLWFWCQEISPDFSFRFNNFSSFAGRTFEVEKDFWQGERKAARIWRASGHKVQKSTCCFFLWNVKIMCNWLQPSLCHIFACSGHFLRHNVKIICWGCEECGHM